jgi:hypothetical protein
MFDIQSLIRTTRRFSPRLQSFPLVRGQRTDDGIISRLAPASPDAARIDLLLQFILAVAAEQDDFKDRELGSIHLLKYAYLADVAHAERRDGETFTGAPWRFHHFGPWATEVFDRIEPALIGIGAEAKRVRSLIGDDFVRYRLATADAQRVRDRVGESLPPPVQFAVERAVHEFGQDTASLLHSVYRTDPMVSAAPEDTLDFNVVVRETAPDYVVETRSPEPAQGKKARTRRLNAIRAEVQARLAKASVQSSGVMTTPRYDDVFAAGVQWLDRLAGEPVPETGGNLSIGADIWKSDTRREPDIP